MTRLTNAQRDKIINHVMSEIVTEDYAEQAKAYLLEKLEAAMPAKIKAIYSDNETRPYVNTASTYLRWCRNYVYAPAPGNSFEERTVKAALGAEGEKQMAQFERLYTEQSARIAEMQRSLKAALYGLTTHEQLKKTFPDLVRYLPADAEISNLPAVQIMNNLRALGYPKD